MGSSIEVVGKVCSNEKAPGKIDVAAEEVKVLGNTYYDKLPFEINSNYLFNHLNKICKRELEMYKIDLPDEVFIPRITLQEAHAILLDKYNKKSPIGNIYAEGEVLISKYVKEKYNCDFVFLTKYPISKRPMYTMLDDFDFYLEAFKYGMPPHGGFAIGLERLTMKILNLTNIREATLIPRDMSRLTP